MDDKTLTKLIRSYQTNNSKHAENGLTFYKSLPTLEELIYYAAMAIDPNGKRSSHQRRLKKVTLESVKNNLLENQDKLRAAKSFEEIKGLVEKCAISGFGRLAKYDTALKIGAWLNLYPTTIHLHAGTRDGARALGLDVSNGFLTKEELPKPLQDLGPLHIENFLCIYKKQLKNPDNQKVSDCATDSESVIEKNRC
jgi:hypothetical protein